jgi:hypothetical protein
MVSWKRVGQWTLVAGMLLARTGWAGSIGLASLDTFVGNAQLWLTGLGAVFFGVGLAGWYNQQTDMVHLPMLSGVMPMIVRGGIFGGGTALATGVGLIAGGGTLPV